MMKALLSTLILLSTSASFAGSSMVCTANDASGTKVTYQRFPVKCSDGSYPNYSDLRSFEAVLAAMIDQGFKITMALAAENGTTNYTLVKTNK